ncbi:hydroxypyruvate isomerase family protein [Roseiconus lacunae]|uniref:hydroxypyruvate isomerase family protein n=1 Tax=Roseiconus lacunae TaxID=2605694 RepID=UPI0011F23392|nr:TIM barrel protein [Roseiconus lacunae]MCD0459287.1 TIM barrel protein [Roseiconus lacunae]
MPGLKPSVCIDAVFEDVPKAEAIAKVKSCGIDAFEFWGWWDKDLAEIEDAKAKHDMQIASCCTKFVSLVDPATRREYLDGLAESIEAAKRLDCPTIISQVGDFREDVSHEEQHDCLVEGLREAAPMLEQAGVVLVFEPLNDLIDHVGYYLVRSEQAFAIVDHVDSPNVKVVFDIYHQQISEGNVTRNVLENIDRIGHLHAAGNPGRNELTRGELNYAEIFSAIRGTDYDGYVGLEYWPLEDPEAGLKQAKSLVVA